MIELRFGSRRAILAVEVELENKTREYLLFSTELTFILGSQVIQTALANPLDKFQLGIRKFIEEFMVQRMGENDKIVTRYMDDPEFQNAAFPILAKAIFEAVRSKAE